MKPDTMEDVNSSNGYNRKSTDDTNMGLRRRLLIELISNCYKK